MIIATPAARASCRQLSHNIDQSRENVLSMGRRSVTVFLRFANLKVFVLKRLLQLLSFPHNVT